MIIVKSPEEIQLMKKAGKIVAGVHREMAKHIKPGITTMELDRLAEEFILRAGAKPAFKGYHGFPASICTSINEQVVHGIPSERVLQEGDIISVDVGAILNGFYGDSAKTYGVGSISEEAKKLISVTRQSFYDGIEYAVKGNRLSDISSRIQKTVEENGFSVVVDYVGHGIGRDMHEDPPVPNFGIPNRGPRLAPGMALAIEPMVNVGTYKVKTLEDNWTVVTLDGKYSAHYEHTIAISPEGPPEILTIE
ncbi:type I methionyl aminopeptidase [Alkalibacter saccharofermentans]|uniref:Methionine aminopeptidase n=1 Tax=Alkalibacter saccharofermentans DSM 14828 TaxID=1120975 RepID=A0A1M4Y9H1_9FIRM|nr:type I methionyl aminopeptidase [Alkalibacter saccharofermentans]SHF02259.1 methionine aminopeptidase, type I [Alkalibacter saccharofermentans DSM 14828]